MMYAYRNDPLMSLNYAVFLYNTGDKSAAARQFHNFEKRFQSVSGTDMDPEVTSLFVFSRAFCMLRGATQPVRMCRMLVCLCVESFFPTNPYLQAGLTDLDEIWHDGRS